MLVNPESMPVWIRWSHYVSIFFWSYSAMMVSLMCRFTGLPGVLMLAGFDRPSNAAEQGRLAGCPL